MRINGFHQNFQKRVHADQWNRKDPCIHSQMIFDRVPKLHSMKRIVSSANDVGKARYPYAKKEKLDLYLIPYTKINSKWNKDLKVTPFIFFFFSYATWLAGS